MANRSRDWNEGLAEDLQDPDFAREFLAAAFEEGVPLEEVVEKIQSLADSNAQPELAPSRP